MIKQVFTGNKIIQASLTSLLFLSLQPVAFGADSKGLWLGKVEVKYINQVHGALTEGEGTNKVDMTECEVYPPDSSAPCDPVEMPQPVPHPFHLEMLLHVDSGGVVNLLREVYVMQTKKTDDSNSKRVLITKESELSKHEGIIRRNGKLVGVRLTGISFPFSMNSDRQPVSSGSLSKGGTLLISLSQGKSHPTNPFRHQYHPTHGEGTEIARSIVININSAKSGDGVDPKQGFAEFSGVYSETLAGLHKNDLKVAGNILLTRVSTIGVLNAVESTSGGAVQ